MRDYFAELDGPQSIDNGKLGRQLHKGAKTPKAPDYKALAQQQADLDRQAMQDQTVANRPNQVDDTGSTTWTQANQGTAAGFDQTNYDKAMTAWQAKNASGGGIGNQPSGMANFWGVNSGANRGGSAGAMPNRANFAIAATPGSGKWTQTTHLNDRLLPGLEAQQRTNTGLAQGAEGMYKDALASVANPMDETGLPAWGDPSHQSVKDVQDATYALMAPELLRQRKAAENQLITQGVGRGANEAWGQGQRVLGSNENDAILKSILAGTTEAGNVFNRQNQSHLNEYNQRVNDRARPMAELSGLMGMTQGAFANPNFPSFATAGNAGSAQVAQAGSQAYNAAMQQANMQNQQSGNRAGGLMGLAGAGIGAYFGGPAGASAGASIGSSVGSGK